MLLLAYLKRAISGAFKQLHMKHQNKNILTSYTNGKLVPLLTLVELHLDGN